MNLPATLITTIQNSFGERGRQFLEALPQLLEEARRRWQLTDIQLAQNLSYNVVAFAHRGETEVVLKLGVPDAELTSGITALRVFDGRGAVRLLDSDEARGTALLERLRPGELLADLPDDAQSTRVAADVMLALWRPAPLNPQLIRLGDWFNGFDNLRARFDGGTGPLDRRLVERAESVVRDFFAESYAPTLLHGDLHHFNILSSQRGWLAIDPKGVVGPAAYEVGPLLVNPWVVRGLSPRVPRLTEQRLSILSECLGFECERLRQWGIAHAVLSAWWSIEGREDWKPAMECARVFARMSE